MEGLRFAGRFGAAAFVTRFAAFFTVFFAAFFVTLRVALRATLRVAFLTELFVRAPPRRRALPFFALFLDALFFFVAPFFRELDLRAFFFLVAIRCAPRDEKWTAALGSLHGKFRARASATMRATRATQ
ncbi:MAG: hypothetical protein JJD97_09410 [Gemmatimonadaceae bacterium]|nr:hypothetical protein [Gemmatimonadaceae bacterium]